MPIDANAFHCNMLRDISLCIKPVEMSTVRSMPHKLTACKVTTHKQNRKPESLRCSEFLLYAKQSVIMAIVAVLT